MRLTFSHDSVQVHIYQNIAMAVVNALSCKNLWMIIILLIWKTVERYGRLHFPRTPVIFESKHPWWPPNES